MAKFNLIDLHNHTVRCGHAHGAMREYAERARALGLLEFGFSEHSPWMIMRHGQINTTREELPDYVTDVQRLAEEFNRGGAEPFTVRLGLEADFVPSRLDETRATLGAYPWDYIIGSVHHLGFWCLPDSQYRYNFDHVPFSDLCDLYFEIIAHMARERICDFIAHLDVIKRFGHRAPDGLLPWVEPLIPLLRRQEIAIEINTSGFDHEIEEQYPGWDVIEALHAGGVGLLLNSDSHAPEHVGRHFDRVVPELLKRGITKLVRYERREPIEYSLV